MVEAQKQNQDNKRPDTPSVIFALLFTVEEIEDSSCSRAFLYGGHLKESSVDINGKSSDREATST